MQSISAPLSGSITRPPAIALRWASDARLARLAAKGSEEAMAAIFERHHQPLQRYCHSIVGNGHDAADALQNTMIKALRALPGETRQIALRPWLYRIAHNESISLLRARRADSDLAAAAHVSDPAAAGAAQSRERLRCLTEDLGELTERQRGALLMRELGGLDFTEVAAAFQTSASAVKQSVYEARRALQAMQEGRAMECENVRRTLSDGDRRMLRGMRMRGHLRACAGCHDFEVALHRRPAQLAAMIPPLPVAAAAAMLHGILGGGGAGSGGGLPAGLAGSATKATTGFSMAAKAGAVVAVSATLAGGAVFAVPELGSASPDPLPPRYERVDATNTPRSTPAAASVAAQRRTSRASAAGRSRRRGARMHGAAQSREGAVKIAARRGAKRVTGRPLETPLGRPSGFGDPPGSPGGEPPRTGTSSGTPSGTPPSDGGPARKPPEPPKPPETPDAGKPGKPAEGPGGEATRTADPRGHAPAGHGHD